MLVFLELSMLVKSRYCFLDIFASCKARPSSCSSKLRISFPGSSPLQAVAHKSRVSWLGLQMDKNRHGSKHISLSGTCFLVDLGI
jgi:hypothetical protein